MTISRDIRSHYEELADLLQAVAARVGDIVRAHCAECGYLFEERVKTLESVAEKIECGRFPDWSSLDDLYACSIIIPLPSQESSVVDFLNTAFQQISLRNRDVQLKPPEAFRFDSTRFVGRLRQTGPEETVGTLGLSQMRFEVQVRTVFDYAWGKATHSLVYKAAGSEWKALRLAAQLKAITETLEMLVLGFEQATAYVADGKWPVVEDKAAIRAFFQSKLTEGLIPSELKPESWSRFVDNVHRLFMAFEGQDPTRMSFRKLERLREYLSILHRAINELGIDRFPRSISLFQFVVGALGSVLTVRPGHSYYLPVPSDMNWLFGNLSIPGLVFGKSESSISQADETVENNQATHPAR